MMEVPYPIGTSIPIVCGFDSDAIRRDLKPKIYCIFNSISRLAGIEHAYKHLINGHSSSGVVFLLTILLTYLTLTGDARCGAMCNREKVVVR